MSDASEDAFSSMSSKNRALERKTIVEQRFQISNEIRTEKKQRRDLFNELKLHCGSSKTAKKRIDVFKAHLEKENTKERGGECEYEDSQEYLIKDLLDADKNIAQLEKMKENADGRIKFI